MNSVELVRSTCEEVMRQAQHVSINQQAIEQMIADESKFPVDVTDALSKIQWDSCGWHYNKDAQVGGPLTAQYILVLDALNFCFWPCQSLEYDHLAIGLKNALEQDSSAFDAGKLSVVTEDTIRSWIPGWDVPNIHERVQRVREVGQVLQAEFDGLAANIIKQANHSACKVVSLITSHFPGFRDASVYKGRLVHFYKRAQIFVADIWGAYNKPTDPSHAYYFHDIDRVTMFADYRIPQILFHVKVMEYSADLTRRILNKEVIPFGSEEESEIRAATVISVEKIREAVLAKRGVSLLAVEVDWLLWNWGESVKDEIAPHHRTLTIFY